MKEKFSNIAISCEAQRAVPYLLPAMARQEAAVSVDPVVYTHSLQEQGGGCFQPLQGPTRVPGHPVSGRALGVYSLALYLTVADGEHLNIP